MRKKAWTVRYGRVDEYINLCVDVGMDIVVEPRRRRASLQATRQLDPKAVCLRKRTKGSIGRTGIDVDDVSPIIVIKHFLAANFAAMTVRTIKRRRRDKPAVVVNNRRMLDMPRFGMTHPASRPFAMIISAGNQEPPVAVWLPKSDRAVQLHEFDTKDVLVIGIRVPTTKLATRKTITIGTRPSGHAGSCTHGRPRPMHSAAAAFSSDDLIARRA